MEQKENQIISIPESTDWIDRVEERASANIEKYDSCTQSILAAFMDELNIKNPMLFKAAGTLHGGMLSSLTCGIHSAGMLVLGMFVGREKIESGLDGILPGVVPAQDLIKRLNKLLGAHSCFKLTGVDFTDMNQAINYYSSDAQKNCFKRVADGTKEIALFLNEMNDKGDLFSV
jgi:hypothetical protein